MQGEGGRSVLQEPTCWDERSCGVGDTTVCEPRDAAAGPQFYGSDSIVSRTAAAIEAARLGGPKPPSRQMTRLPNVVHRALVRAWLG